jgi:hypothetical protein
VTHPFHPLNGCEFELASSQLAWGELRVYFYDRDGELKRLPASWTDAVPPDPFVMLAAGRSPVRIDDMLRLVDLLRELEGGRG